MEFRVETLIDRVYKKIGVLEVSNGREVGGDARRQQSFFPKRGAGGSCSQPHANAVIEQDRSDQQSQIRWIPPSIKKQGCGHQPGNGDTMVAPGAYPEKYE